LNSRPRDYESRALPTELLRPCVCSVIQSSIFFNAARDASVKLERCAHVGMPENRLRNSGIHAAQVQIRRERSPEGVPNLSIVAGHHRSLQGLAGYRHCPAFLLKPGIGVSRIIVSSGMHSFRSQQVAAQDLFTMSGIYTAGKTAQVASQVSEKAFR
jgi:hypothetical protein